MELRHTLHTSIRGNQRCGDYFEQMKRVADQLATAGDPVPDFDLVRSILSGLGSDYNSFVVVITTRTSPISLVDLHAFLLSHESLLTSQHTVSSNTADLTAFYAGEDMAKGAAVGDEPLISPRTLLKAHSCLLQTGPTPIRAQTRPTTLLLLFKAEALHLVQTDLLHPPLSRPMTNPNARCERSVDTKLSSVGIASTMPPILLHLKHCSTPPLPTRMMLGF